MAEDADAPPAICPPNVPTGPPTEPTKPPAVLPAMDGVIEVGIISPNSSAVGAVSLNFSHEGNQSGNFEYSLDFQ